MTKGIINSASASPERSIYGFDIFGDNKDGKSVFREKIAVKAHTCDEARQTGETWARERPEFFLNPRIEQCEMRNAHGQAPIFEEMGEDDIRRMGYLPLKE